MMTTIQSFARETDESAYRSLDTIRSTLQEFFKHFPAATEELAKRTGFNVEITVSVQLTLPRINLTAEEGDL